ncbi:alpha/beta fold hydrolase [Mycobacterium sp. NAZ190054]|uniref:alpha/beta fold hydrolase n=1 Tax=Mycobacterium sp. NAZ190054 TaxID=1747766 RepID=UPI000794E779|nr:alpha/beta hydrolase [Mycobacterium sp. NAZ190054]KWX68090.1 hydrolase [Mycobacterium sp. NAZ190054]
MVNLDRRVARPNAAIAFADSDSDGVPVVLTHGAGVDHSMFDAQAADLVRQGFRVIVWDLRGHGQSWLADGVRFAASDALADLDALLVECDATAPVLVGHSLGGNLVQAFAREHPDRVGAVVVLDSTWNTGPLSALERFALRIAAPALSLIPAGRLPRLMARASAVTPDAVARTEALFARMPKSRFLDVWRATVSFVDPDPRHRFPVPLALIRGAEDRTGNIATAMPRWAAAEGAAEYVIPGAGHIVTWDAPELTSRTLIEILENWRNALRTQSPS